MKLLNESLEKMDKLRYFLLQSNKFRVVIHQIKITHFIIQNNILIIFILFFNLKF